MIPLADYLKANPEGFALNEAGRIASPGKFEGEPLYTAFFHGLMMEGCEDDSGEDWSAIELTDEDRAAHEDLDGKGLVVLHYRSDGFVWSETLQLERVPAHWREIGHGW